MRELTARGYRTSRGNPFNKNSICRIITNEMYLGVYKYADIRIEGGVPAMIRPGAVQPLPDPACL